MSRPYDTRRWRRLRILQLVREPFCRLHSDRGLLVIGEDVDHLVPLADGGSFDDPANLRSLCHSCHSSVTRAWQTGKPEPTAKDKHIDVRTGIAADSWWNEPKK